MTTMLDRPRPEVLESWLARDGTPLAIRPMSADDAGRELRFIEALSPQSRYERSFAHRGLRPGELRQLVQFDVRREVALAATTGSGAAEELVAVARLKKSPDGSVCEFALVVGDAWQRQGVGRRLLERLMTVARQAGVTRVTGHTMATNPAMKSLAHALGFTVAPDPDDATVTLLSIAL
jgi:acetyltransferase